MSSELRGELVQSGVNATMSAIVAFAEGLLPIVGRISRGEPAAPKVRSNTKQPSAFELELVMLSKPHFMPLSIAGASHKVASFWRGLLLTNPADAPKQWSSEHGARRMLIDHLDLECNWTGTEWAFSAFSHWALQQTHIPHILGAVDRLRHGTEGLDANASTLPAMQPTGQSALTASEEELLVARVFGGNANRKAIQRASRAFLHVSAIEFHLNMLNAGSGGAEHAADCTEDKAFTDTAVEWCDPRHSELPTKLKSQLLGPSRATESFFKLLVEWRYGGFRACADAHNKFGISPANLFHGEGERQMLMMELKRHGLSAKFKSFQLGKVPPHCLRPSPYPYFGQPSPWSAEALRQKMPLLTISWAAGLDTSFEDKKKGIYLDLAEEEEDPDYC